jgi:hypothetical protein
LPRLGDHALPVGRKIIFADLKYTGFVGYTFSNQDKKIVFYTLGGEIVFAFSDIFLIETQGQSRGGLKWP